MTNHFLFQIGVVLAMSIPSMASEPYEPWPSKDKLRGIEQAAYACSRDNSKEACLRVRQIADPLMDHSRLPGLCKDVLWSLMDAAKVANTNDFRRKDTITNAARRVQKVCAEQMMKKSRRSIVRPEPDWVSIKVEAELLALHQGGDISANGNQELHAHVWLLHGCCPQTSAFRQGSVRG